MDKLSIEVGMGHVLDQIFPHWRGKDDMIKTPARVAAMYEQLLTPEEFEFTVFRNTEQYDQIILQKNIPFYSLCAHHLLPFIGKAHVAYIPDKEVVGLSKLARLVKYYSRTLGTQEEVTQKAGTHLVNRLHPVGASVIIEATHMCMAMRGAEADDVSTTTSFMWGAFRLKPEARAELMSMIYGGS
jgi:GTP cyclohydrolase IA